MQAQSWPRCTAARREMRVPGVQQAAGFVPDMHGSKAQRPEAARRWPACWLAHELGGNRPNAHEAMQQWGAAARTCDKAEVRARLQCVQQADLQGGRPTPAAAECRKGIACASCKPARGRAGGSEGGRYHTHSDTAEQQCRLIHRTREKRRRWRAEQCRRIPPAAPPARAAGAWP